MPQGSASLEGAEFTFKYYDGYLLMQIRLKMVEEAVRTWVFANRRGRILHIYSEEYKVSGDDFYYHVRWSTQLLPLGTLTIEETKAPEGIPY